MRRYVGDVFPDLNTSFADTVDPANPGSQHFWTVFSVGCNPGSCSGTAPSSYGGSAGDYWGLLMSERGQGP